MKFFINVILLCLAFNIHAQVPQTMSYQGVLTNENGNAVADGSYKLKFELHTTPNNGTIPWQETHENVPVINGLFNVILGSINPLDISFDELYFLAISVNDGERLEPFTPLTSVPYSLGLADSIVVGSKIATGQVVRSLNGLTDNVQLLEGSNITITPRGSDLVISATGGGGGDITSVSVGEGLAGGGEEGDVLITLADSGITAIKIAKSQVVRSINAITDEVTIAGAGGAIVTTRNDSIIINAGSGGDVTGIQQIQNTDNSLTITNATGPTTNISVKSLGITTDKLGNRAVTTAKIADGAVSTNKIANSAITASKLAASARPWAVSGNDMFSTVSGDIGIGTNNPLSKLDLRGDLRFDGLLNLPKGSRGFNLFYNDDFFPGSLDAVVFEHYANNSTAPGTGMAFGLTNSTGVMDTTMVLRFFSNKSYVGIGMSRPRTQLHVGRGSDVSVTGGGYLTLGKVSSANIGIDNNEIMARNNGATATLNLNINGGTVAIGGPTTMNGGSDVALAGGGFLTLGSTSAQNIGIDNNEIMARNNGAASTLFLNADGGKVSIRTLSGASTEDVNITGSMKLDVGATENLIFKASASGTDPAIYPTKSEFGLVGKSGNEFFNVRSKRFYAESSFNYLAYSDRRIKEDIRPIPSAMAVIEQLNGVKYAIKREHYYKAGARGGSEAERTQQLGFVAQDVEKVLPQLVQVDEETGLKTVGYMGLIPVLVEALKEQQTMIQKLTARIEELEK